MKKIAGLTLLFLAALHLSYAQLQDCSTITGSKQQLLESGFTDSVSSIMKLNRTFHLNFHLVKNEEGETGIQPSLIEMTINEVNKAFEPIAVKFKLSKINAIDNFNFNTIYFDNSDNELLDVSFIPNTINVYLVDKLYDREGRITCSYTYLPAEEKDAMFIQKSCFDASRVIHLIGHVFNLYHTHEDVFGESTVDGANCSHTGDLCCDTEAMTDLSLLVNDDCEYTGRLKDENGKFYYPSTRNYMSFAPSECRCYFSEEQYIRMINAILKLKTDLW